MTPAPKSMSSRRLACALGACALTATLAACNSNATAASGPATRSATAAAKSSAPAVTPSAATHPATTHATPAPATATSAPAPATGCASSPAAHSTGPGPSMPPGGSITVCPDAAPVGATVHITIDGCAPIGSGLPVQPAASLQFLGPNSWLGTGGGGGATVRFTPQEGSIRATATFTIPATYTGGNEKPGPYPTLTTEPGTNYAFMTDPAGDCNVHFTVLPG